MGKNLVIVESPAKANTIEKYLGKSAYTVKATMGHLRDLPKSQFGIDVDEGFEPKYITVRGKTSLVRDLHKLAGQVKKVYLATDPDREGEAIAWHLAALLGISPEEPCRIEFNEITKSAVSEAIKKARKIDVNMVNAQQARRVLDRIVGYKLSPLLWKKVRRGLSAGRVQSVAVRLICDREREIEAFQVTEYWSIHAQLQKMATSETFEAELIQINGKRIEIIDQEAAVKIKSELSRLHFKVTDIKRRDRQRKPYPPFITSTLQQDASHKLGFGAKKTMILAQQLYEAGHITYMRTDSTRVSVVAQQEAREWVSENLGKEYLPAVSPHYAKKSAQDAHEAIRPTLPKTAVEQLPAGVSRDQRRIYELIWKRFMASQMKPAVYDTMTVEIVAGIYGLRASGSVLRFRGFLSIYSDSVEISEGRQEADHFLPMLVKDEEVSVNEICPVQHFTEPPPRYTEAALVRLMEEKGIGRPSTYAPTIETIQARNYVVKTDKKIFPTPLGFIVVDLLKQYFPDIVDIGFTAAMENNLDAIAQGDSDWRELTRKFYEPFMEMIGQAEREAPRVKVPEEITDITCESCGSPMAIKQGRFGAFLGCTKFPECRNTRPLLKEIGVGCPLCDKPIVERKTKNGRLFYGCSNFPTCNFVSWNKPTNESCPVCGAYMTERKMKNQPEYTECSNENCESRKGRIPAKPGTELLNESGAPSQSDRVSMQRSAARKQKKTVGKIINKPEAPAKKAVSETETTNAVIVGNRKSKLASTSPKKGTRKK